MRNSEMVVIGSNHRLDKGGEFPRALERRGIAFDVVDLSKELPSPEKIGGIIALGSPYKNSPAQIAWYRALIEAGTPGIGVCVAHQGMGEALGGRVTAAPKPEYGFAGSDNKPYRLKLTADGAGDHVLGPVVKDHPAGVIFEFHNAQIKVNPETTIVIAKGEDDVVQALRAKNPDGSAGSMLGVQFHPEIKDPEAFFAIYEEVFGLTENRKNDLREQYERYRDTNVGSDIVEKLIDTFQK